MKKHLIVYYSWSCGNTERIAKALQSVAGGDLVRLDTAVPYTGSYNDVVDQGQREVNAGFEPKLKPLPINVADYDVSAVGTPTDRMRRHLSPWKRNWARVKRKSAYFFVM